MSVLAILDPDARIVVRAGALVIERAGEPVRSVPVHLIECVQIHGRADLTPAARDLLLREGKDVVFLTAAGTYLGRLVGAESRLGALRLAQYRFLSHDERRLGLARRVVAGKLAAQRSLLLSRQRMLRSEQVADAVTAMRDLLPRVETATNLDVLRGLEGLGARHYFSAFGTVLRNPLFSFNGRNRRPPRDPINAALSFVYALALPRVDSALRRVGLDPYVGALHEAGRGAPTLALDLLEEWRPIADAVVLTLFNRRQLNPEDFRTPLPEELGAEAEVDEGAVWLGKLAGSIVVRAWEQRLSESVAHPISGQTWAMRALFSEQAAQVARLVRGEAEDYVPLSVRT